MAKNNITFLGEVNFRNQNKKFGIKPDDRRRHIYILGKTGVGKSTLLENMIVNDILAGHGVAFLDPHGESAEKILDYIPENRVEDVIYVDPSDMAYPIAFNPLEQVGTEYRHLVASGIMGVLQKIWVDAWSARMEYIMNNTLLALLEYPGTTLLGIMRMLNDANYRKVIVENLKDPVVKSFWVNEFARYSQKFETEATAAIQNKVGQFVSNPLVRNILGQAKSKINIRQVMDEQKIMIFNLSKGKMGEDNSALLGAMMITKIQLAAMSRVDVPEGERKDFYLYVDEFQNFATESFASILSEARKYRLSLAVANQYLDQLDEQGKNTVRSAVFGNVGTMVIFRVGAEDGEFLEKEFFPEFTGADMTNLAKYNIYVKMMIDGLTSRPFSATTLPPPPKPKQSFKDVIIENSRLKYAVPREVVDKQIADEWLPVGAEAAQRRVERKEERSLGEMLKEGGAPIRQRPPFAPQRGATEGRSRFESRPRPMYPKPPFRPDKRPPDVGGLKDLIKQSIPKAPTEPPKPKPEDIPPAS